MNKSALPKKIVEPKATIASQAGAPRSVPIPI